MKKLRSIFMYFFVLCMTLSIVGCSNKKEVKAIKGDNTVIIKGKYLISEEEDQFGIMDLKKKQIVENTYNSIIYFKSVGLFCVNNDEKWGLMNEKEEVIIPIEYTFFDEDKNGEIYASDGKQTQVYNKKGDILKTLNYAIVYNLGNDTYLGIKDINYDEESQQYIPRDYELVDVDGNIIKSFDYDQMTILYDTKKTFEKGEAMSLYVQKGDDCGVLNLQGETLIPMVASTQMYMDQTGTQTTSFKDNMMYNSYTKSYLVEKEEKFGVYDNTGKLIIDFNYNLITATMNGYVATINDGTKEGTFVYYYDLQGNEMFHVQGYGGEPFSNKGYASIMNEDGTYLVNKKGERIEFDILDKEGIYIGKFDSIGRAGIRYEDGNKQRIELIDDQGKEVIKPIKVDANSLSYITYLGEEQEGFNSYRAVEEESNSKSTNYAAVIYKDKMKDGMQQSVFDKTILYDKKGKKLAEFDSMLIEGFSNGMLLVSKESDSYGTNYKKGLVDKNGKILSEIKYENIIEYDDYFYAEDTEKCYLLDKKTGEIVLEY